MDDLERLEEAFSSGTLLRPAGRIPTIVDLAHVLVQLANGAAPRKNAHEQALAKLIAPSDHLVFILADGVGSTLLKQLPPKSFLRTHVRETLQTVFPSSTAPALTSLATGLWPSQHAITGWWTHLPQLNDAATILPYVDRAASKTLRGRIDPADAFPKPSTQGRIKRDYRGFFPGEIAHTTYSDYATANQPRSGYRGLQDAVNQVIARIRTAKGPTYTYLYIPDVDEAEHHFGTGDCLPVLKQVNDELVRLSQATRTRARLILTADHGFKDPPAKAKFRLKPTPELNDLLSCPPSGDARVLYFHALPRAEARLRAYLNAVWGDAFVLLTAAQVQALHLFGPGPLTAETRRRIGTHVALSLGASVAEYTTGPTAGRLLEQRSHHSGLTPDELLVPLVIA